MIKKECYEKVIVWFQENVFVVEMELYYNNLYELLIVVIFFVQCIDKWVNMIIFRIYQDFFILEVLVVIILEVIFEYICSVFYFNNKLKYLVGMVCMLVNDFNSEVFDIFEELIKLFGVGCKMVNVIQFVVFNKVVMVVDIYVFCVSYCIGLVSNFCIILFSVEKELMKNIFDELIFIVYYWLILYGCYVCQVCIFKCEICGL